MKKVIDTQSYMQCRIVFSPWLQTLHINMLIAIFKPLLSENDATDMFLPLSN